MKQIFVGTLAGIALAASAAVAFAADPPSDDKIATDKGDVAIHAIHHAALTLTWNGVVVLADPAPAPGAKGDPTAEYKTMPAPALILYTHDHGDHFNADILSAVAGKATIVAPKEVADKIPEALKAQTKVLANGGKMDFNGIGIEAVAMYNTTPDRAKFHPKGGGNGYILTLGGKRVYVAGDTEETPEMKALTNIDVAFIPMNLPYTMPASEAADCVKAFKPKVAIPYHYQGQKPEEFQEAVKGAGIEVRLLNWYPAAGRSGN
jgi:L-ascorbate metabolism protein UlaG (beta-lactamase superfamily)